MSKAKTELSFSGCCRRELLSLPLAKKCCRRAFDVGVLLGGGESEEDLPSVIKCDGCAGALLRGLFVTCGSVNDPKKSRYLQFAFSDKHSSDEAKGILVSCGVAVKNTLRRGRYILYCKESAVIESFLGVVGATQTLFDFINGGIERSIRNEANRIANCETRNIEKSVDAARKQLDAIELLAQKGKLNGLESELYEAAMLRLEFQSLSLAELGEKANPTVSKSGMNHRLNRIIEKAEKLK